MIQLESVNKTFIADNKAVTALQNINLKVEASSIFGVIGSSGAGKSTLIRCVNFLEIPDSGGVIVNGMHLNNLDQQGLRHARQKIGMIFQHFNLLSSRNVYQNIALPLELLGHNKADIKAKVLPLLELVGLTDKAQSFPSQLSGGQKQRVAIARALSVEPKVLLCDEATSALDPKTTQSILQLLADINQQLNLTILLITHEMHVVKTICDHVAVIDQGKIIEENNVESFFIRPKTALANQFVRSAMRDKLPNDIACQLQSGQQPGFHPIVRLIFVGYTVNQPLISQVCKQFNIDMSILQSHMDYVHGRSMGFITFEVIGDQQNIQDALRFIKQQQNINLEVAGYVDRRVTTAH